MNRRNEDGFTVNGKKFVKMMEISLEKKTQADQDMLQRGGRRKFGGFL